MLRRIQGWVREHPRLVDSAAAAPLFFGGVAGALATQDGLLALLGVVISFGLCAPVVIRRERPVLAFGLAAAVALVQWMLHIELMPADFVAFAALYNVASRCGRNVSIPAAGVVEIGAFLALARWYPNALAFPFQFFSVSVFVVSVWIWGNTVGTRRAYLASLEERALRLERERDNQARIAAAGERARIAREMHDVVSHSLSVMVVQADGAAYAMDADTDRARRALGTISSTGRQALTEMRRMLGVLREEDGAGQQAAQGPPGGEEYAPQPGIGQLEALLERVRKAGLPVEFTVEGQPRELPGGMELAVYRIVQEALTNTLKHAGPSVSWALVRLRYGGEALELLVSDDGRGGAALPDPDGRPGHGLIGLRERVSAYGGSVRTGPKSGGGYEVNVVLPLQRANT